jgi:hypothetical protein
MSDSRRASPISVLLSRALVAVTIEVDDLVESRLAHRTTTGPAAGGRGPWLISLAIWQNFLRLLDPAGTPVTELRGAAALTNLDGLRRWGWIRIDDGVVRPTRAALAAAEVERAALAEVEQRWRARFGPQTVATIVGSSDGIRHQLGGRLPRYLPVVAHRLFSGPVIDAVAEDDLALESLDRPAPDLPTALAQVLLALTLDAETGAGVSMPVAANLFAVLGPEPTALRDLPTLTGLAREGVAFAVKPLVRTDRATLGPAPTGRGQAIRLTERGLRSSRDMARRVGANERRWIEAFGADVSRLRATLEQIDGAGVAGASPLLDGLVHPPDGWRSGAPARQRLPRHPMVLHRGGYPDGA